MVLLELLFPKHFLVGTPRTLFPCINARQFPRSNPSPTHPATSHATPEALFPSNPAHQNLHALSPTSPPTHFSKHQSQPSPHGNLVGTFPQQPHPSKFPALSPISPPTSFSKHQPQPSPPGILVCNLAKTFPKQPHPSNFPRCNHFSQAPPPIKISKHFFQVAEASSFPSGAPNQMSKNFFFWPSLRIAPCDLHPTLKKSPESSRYKNISCRGDLRHVFQPTAS